MPPTPGPHARLVLVSVLAAAACGASPQGSETSGADDTSAGSTASATGASVGTADAPTSSAGVDTGDPPADSSSAVDDTTGGSDTGSDTSREDVCENATRWYVSLGGDNSDGSSWASAWNELDQIDWGAVGPGDCIDVEGGTYVQRLVPTAGGTAQGRIVLRRSTEAGHDGKVTFDFSDTATPEYWSGMVRVEQPYLTIDGGDWDMFEWIADSSCLLIVDNATDDDHFELANARLGGYANPDNGGATLCIFSGSVRLEHVWFGTQVGAEDHIKLVTTSHSALDIQNSVFTPWISIDGSHSDLIEQCWPGCEAGDLVFKNNLVWDSGEGGGNLVFTLDAHWTNVDVSHNVFKDTYEVFQFTTTGTQRISNNVFYDVFSTFGGDGEWEAVNNVFVAPPDNSSIVWGSTARYSLWAPGTYGFFDGEGNLEADPMFVDPEDILGPDGEAFTPDDGFNLQAGSPAIDAGTPTVDAFAIGGVAIVGNPDIGAYEHP
jgi:hypothetical protein